MTPDRRRSDHPLIGRRIKLLHCSDPYSQLPPGMLGTIRFVDDFNTVHVDWDDGSKLGLVGAEGDRFEFVDTGIEVGPDPE